MERAPIKAPTTCRRATFFTALFRSASIPHANLHQDPRPMTVTSYFSFSFVSAGKKSIAFFYLTCIGNFLSYVQEVWQSSKVQFSPYDRAPLRNFSLVTMIHTAGRPVSTNEAAIIHHRPEWRGPQFLKAPTARRRATFFAQPAQFSLSLNHTTNFHQTSGPTTITF